MKKKNYEDGVSDIQSEEEILVEGERMAAWSRKQECSKGKRKGQ